MKIIKKILLLSIFIYFFCPETPVIAAQEPPTITIVNPLRGPQLGLENQDLLASLKSQWQYTKDASVSATWLWQYSALENSELTSLAKAEMQNHEQGIFLEIDKNTAEKSGVGYKGRNQWYHSDGLLLVSYDLYERRKIIDAVFEKFHDVFNYYPTSVGAWWVGADSINYMKEKYGITAVLQCADQFNTDAYSIWGTPWSIPYLSRTNNAAVPAQDYDTSSKTVIMQWAPRDPTRAYGDSVTHSTFSMQDYSTKGYDLRYIEYLQNIFMRQQGDQIVFGLEGGVIPQGYRDYGQQVAKTKQWEKEGKLRIQTMREYASEFLQSKSVLPSTKYFLANDYENDDQSFWYHSSKYRVGIIKKGQKIALIDLRDYANTSEEDFELIPNTQKLLRVNTQGVIDSVRIPSQEFIIGDSNQPMSIQPEGKKVYLKTDNRILAELSEDTAKINDRIYTFTPDEMQEKENESLRSQAWWLMKEEQIKTEFTTRKNEILHSKRQLAKVGAKGYLFIGLIITFLILIMHGNRRLASVIPLSIVLLISVWAYQKVQEPVNIVLTNYEANAIKEVVKSGKEVAYLAPEQGLEFRAVTPFIYAKPWLAEKLTGKKWQYIKRTKNAPLESKIQRGTILIVPQYLGQEISAGEMSYLDVKKVYDNAQIVVYEHN